MSIHIFPRRPESAMVRWRFCCAWNNQILSQISAQNTMQGENQAKLVLLRSYFEDRAITWPENPRQQAFQWKVGYLGSGQIKSIPKMGVGL